MQQTRSRQSGPTPWRLRACRLRPKLNCPSRSAHEEASCNSGTSSFATATRRSSSSSSSSRAWPRSWRFAARLPPGYPQLGGDGLHIAHMLWGGLFMTVAMLVLFAALGRVAQRLAAILGGIGFGTFIDELGKFITSDNNYFYEPTIGLIYITFIVIFLVLEAFRRQEPGPSEALANAFNQLELAAGRPLDAETKQSTLSLLAKSDTSDPVVQGLTAFVRTIEPQPVQDMSFYFRARDYAVQLYSRVVLSRWFRPVLITFFLLAAVIQVAAVLLVALARLLVSDPDTLSLGFTDIAGLCSVAVTGVLTFIGIFHLRRSRLAAYHWFVRSVLVSIFVTQVFTFLESELSALWGFALNILIYTALKIMIEQEQRIPPGGETPSTPAKAAS